MVTEVVHPERPIIIARMLRFFIRTVSSKIVIFFALFFATSTHAVLAQNLQFTSSDRTLYRNVEIRNVGQDPLNIATEIFDQCERQGFSPRIGESRTQAEHSGKSVIELRYSLRDSYKCGSVAVDQYRILVFKTEDDSKGRLMAQASSDKKANRSLCSSQFIANFANSFSQFMIISEESESHSKGDDGASLYISEFAKKGLRVAVARELEESCNPAYDGLVREFVEIALTGFSTVLDRSLFESVLEEQMNSLSGIIAESTLVEIGESIGAQGLVSCNVLCVEAGVYCSVKCVNTETTELMWSILCPFEQLATNLERLKTNLK